ncbi:MAG: hypothetical protein KGJ89_03825 [Patescibacteria group bacterium]|nr:hypothetical protein [Patescibacteria group bacterium]MDE2015253.1 hypothetical protein [Patescibacteria group bacterium]MDE2227059.1 hypothetical protein [Patescibacteria group bacterium]
MTELTVWSLNGGRFVGATPNEEPQTLKWLKKLSEPGAKLPDVLCLQDFRVSLLKYLRPLPNFHFAPMTNHKIWGKRELVGICITSKYPMNDIAIRHTWGDGIVRDLDGVDDNNQRIQPGDVADALVLKTENRVAVACTISKPDDPRLWRVATHHGFWVRGGNSNHNQLQSTSTLCNFLAEQGKRYGGIIYTADCNPDKEGRVLRRYSESCGRDCFPPHIKTTVAEHHQAAKFGIKPDHIMVWPNSSGRFTYDVTNVYVDPSPGSDHLMLCSTVRKI